MTTNLKDKIAVVTGGSRGIGRSIAIELASSGATVWVNYTSNPGLAEETVALCKEAGKAYEVKAYSFNCNVSDSEQVENQFEKIKNESGKIDILINNAGISRDGLFVRMKNEDWNETLSVNLNGAFYCARICAKFMMKNKYGRIVNVSSVVGEMGNAGQAAYSTSKAGLFGLTKTLAKELGSRNITVNAVTPGFIETDMTNALSETTKEEHKGAIPLGRFGKAEEVAAAVSFLVSDQAAYITGQILGINGGMYM